MNDRRRAHPDRSREAAFTLLELVLVLVIMSTALAVVAPSLRGWNKGTQLQNAANQFLSVTRWARSQALADSQVYRLNVNAMTGQYWLTVQNGAAFEPIGSDFGQVFAVPSGYRIDMNDATSQQALSAVDFFPNGRTQLASVRITSDDGAAVDVKSVLPSEGFDIASVQEPLQ